MENKQLNSVESIELIQKMIAQTREKFENGAGRPFLIWGYSSAAVTFAVLLIYNLTLNPNAFWGWWAIPVLGYALNHIISKPTKTTTPQVKTHIDSFISNVWAVLGAILILIPAAAIFTFPTGDIIMPLEGVILSAGVVIMGLTVKVPAVTIGGIIAGAISFAMFFFLPQAPYMFLFMFIFAMIIPGHILNAKAKAQCSKN